MRRASRHVGWLICGLMCWASPASADVVVDWNLIATQAMAAAGTSRQGPAGARHGDRAAGDARRHAGLPETLRIVRPSIGNASGSPVAAVAKASRDVLIGVGLTSTPSGSVDTLYTNYLTARGLLNDPGLAVGQQAAARILALRANNDGRVPANAEQFFGGTGVGEWRPTSFCHGAAARDDRRVHPQHTAVHTERRLAVSAGAAAASDERQIC